MALNNYANLKTSVAEWSKRSDLTALLDDYLDLCEVQIYENQSEPLRIRSMMQSSIGATSASVRTQALPTGYLESRRYDFEISGQRPTIDYVTPASMVIRDGSGVPQVYTVTDQIEYDIQPDLVYVTNLDYYGKLTALSSSNTTNDILTNHPNIYLYGCLMVLYQFTENDQQSIKYQSLFWQAIAAANAADRAGNAGVATQKRKRGRNP